ncbi:MAG: hypothetical protein D6808_06875, partial [Candidatus Dadabacteria bacterium]
MAKVDEQDRYMRVGFYLSLGGHLLCFLAILFGSFPHNTTFRPPTVYSVTLEAGTKLGGISQAPKKEKSRPAPPKKIQPKRKRTKTLTNTEKKAKPQKKKEEKVVIKKKKKPKPAKKKITKKKKPIKTPKKKAPKKTAPKKSKPKKPPSQKKEDLSLKDLDKLLQKATQRYTGESSDAGGKGFGSAYIGKGKGFGGGISRPKEFFIYRDALEMALKSEWSWTSDIKGLVAQVAFSLTPEGEIY